MDIKCSISEEYLFFMNTRSKIFRTSIKTWLVSIFLLSFDSRVHTSECQKLPFEFKRHFKVFKIIWAYRNRLFREHNSYFNEHCFRPSAGRNVFLTSFSLFRRAMNRTSWTLQACAEVCACNRTPLRERLELSFFIVTESLYAKRKLFVTLLSCIEYCWMLDRVYMVTSY